MIPKKDLDKILDAKEQGLLRQFAENEPMKSAVRKVLLAAIYYSGTMKKGIDIDPLQNFTLSMVSNRKNSNTPTTNEELGADIRACWEAINELAAAFNRINMYKKMEETPEKSNPAR